MRVAAGLTLVAVVTMGSAAHAHKAAPVDAAAKSSLFKAAFAPRVASPAPTTAATPAALTLSPQHDLDAAATGAVFDPPAQADAAPDSARLLAPDLPVAGQGLAVWRSQEVVLPTRSASGAVDSLRLTLGGVAYAPGGLVLARPTA